MDIFSKHVWGLICSLVISGSTAQAQTVSEVKDLFRDWSPISVEINNTVATVVLPQGRITDEIYYSAIPFGFCLGSLFGVNVDGIEEVIVLNQFEKQGWVFENDAGLCSEIVNLPATSVKVTVAGHSRLF
uniref:hypothetical protein n=1 Tax=Yoonia sp. TaxID=2212373 RepID=UPI004047F14F